MARVYVPENICGQCRTLVNIHVWRLDPARFEHGCEMCLGATEFVLPGWLFGKVSAW